MQIKRFTREGVLRRRHGRRILTPVLLASSVPLLMGLSGSLPAAAATGGKAPIVVKGVGQDTQYPGTTIGFEARIVRFNRDGGVDGRKIKYLGMTDDSGNSSTDLQDVQADVLNSHVLAVAPVYSDGFLAPSSTFLDQNHTLYVGAASTPNWCGDDWAFSESGCDILTNGDVNTALGGAVAKYIKSTTHKTPAETRLAIVSLDIPTASSSVAYGALLFHASGYHIVYNEAPIPANGSATDYSPYVQQVAASHPDLVFLSLDTASAVGFAAAWHAAGEKGLLYGGIYQGGLLKQKNVASATQGLLTFSQASPQEENSPAIKQIEKDLKAIGQGSQQIGGDVSFGYWNADMLVEMLQYAAKKGAPLTSAGVEKAVNDGGFTYKSNLAGGPGSQPYPKAHEEGNGCLAVLVVSGTKFKPVVPFSCYPNVKASAS